jgi:hypothetical protein
VLATRCFGVQGVVFLDTSVLLLEAVQLMCCCEESAKNFDDAEEEEEGDVSILLLWESADSFVSVEVVFDVIAGV